MMTHEAQEGAMQMRFVKLTLCALPWRLPNDPRRSFIREKGDGNLFLIEFSLFRPIFSKKGYRPLFRNYGVNASGDVRNG